MRYKKAYVDIEATYIGEYDINKDDERDKCFKDYKNWMFCCETEHNGKNVKYKGIIGLLILDFDIDEKTQVHKLLDKKFVQLIGKNVTKDNLMKELDGVDEVIGYHCRTKPNAKGYTGYDFGVIGSQLGVVLDELPGVRCIDLELLAHSAGMYGGLKNVEMQIPSVPPRKSGINDGAEEEKLLLCIAAETDEIKRKEMWKKAKRYNHEDVVNLVYIEQYLRKIKMTE